MDCAILGADHQIGAIVQHLWLFGGQMFGDAAVLQGVVDNGNYGPFAILCQVLAGPFQERSGLESFAQPDPLPNSAYLAFCGT